MAIRLPMFVLVVLLAAAVLAPRLGPVSANPLTDIVAVSAGGEHACALTTAGGVKCWGDNQYGQLGDGTTTGPESCAVPGGFILSCSTSPIDVTGLTSGIAAVSAGQDHSCALTTAGGVKCWGYNPDGQLGDGSTTNSSTPVDVTGLGSVTAVSAGNSHTCAVTTVGGVKCWGLNNSGQLGDGQACGIGSCFAPVDVTVVSSSVAAISAGGGHTCAVTMAGGLKCWGSNPNGELGDGQACGSSWCLAAVDVIGLTSGVAAVSAGRTNTCAVTTAGGVKCWGYNGDGQLGNGTFSNSYTPADVTDLPSGAVSVSLGVYYACAFEASGGIECWGWNHLGQLGIGTNIGPAFCFGYSCSAVPLDVVGLVPKPTPTDTPTHTPTSTPPPVGGVSLDPGVTVSPDRTATHRSVASSYVLPTPVLLTLAAFCALAFPIGFYFWGAAVAESKGRPRGMGWWAVIFGLIAIFVLYLLPDQPKPHPRGDEQQLRETDEGPNDPRARLEQLRQLLDDGLITDEQFDKKRDEILDML